MRIADIQGFNQAINENQGVSSLSIEVDEAWLASELRQSKRTWRKTMGDIARNNCDYDSFVAKSLAAHPERFLKITKEAANGSEK